MEIKKCRKIMYGNKIMLQMNKNDARKSLNGAKNRNHSLMTNVFFTFDFGLKCYLRDISVALNVT